MTRMLLVGYLGGIRCQWKLGAGMPLNLAHRWFRRLDVDMACRTTPKHAPLQRRR